MREKMIYYDSRQFLLQVKREMVFKRPPGYFDDLID